MSTKYEVSIRKQYKEGQRNTANKYKREKRTRYEFRAPIKRGDTYRKLPIPKSYVDHPVYGRLRY